jgi:tRNA1Val (adenine37-N6)-methyltransferase
VDVFGFKQFQVTQSKAVHPVGTDGVLIGAWANVSDHQNVLDVGTGTGLIAMMIAQRSIQTKIIAIEPQPEAFQLAKENISKSPFHSQIKVENISFQHFTNPTFFDLIICNPPFFEKSLLPPKEERKLARHSDSLPYLELIRLSKSWLASNGTLALITPVPEGNKLFSIAIDSGLFLSRQCAVFSKSSKPQERWMLEFSRTAIENPIQSSLTLMGADGKRTKEYHTLTKDFYLDD